MRSAKEKTKPDLTMPSRTRGAAWAESKTSSNARRPGRREDTARALGRLCRTREGTGAGARTECSAARAHRPVPRPGAHAQGLHPTSRPPRAPCTRGEPAHPSTPRAGQSASSVQGAIVPGAQRTGNARRIGRQPLPGQPPEPAMHPHPTRGAPMRTPHPTTSPFSQAIPDRACSEVCSIGFRADGSYVRAVGIWSLVRLAPQWPTTLTHSPECSRASPRMLRE